MSDYELTDSDYDYDENEKILLEATRNRKPNEDSEEEVFPIQSAESNEEDDDDNFDEDIEDYEDDLPNAKAWGQKRKIYYNTDYVDGDYGGFQGKDAEDAEYEEQEARVIQERLLQELDETDYMLDFTQTSPSKEEKVEEKIKTDVSGLSKRDKLALFAKESPEFAGLVEDFKEKMSESETKLQPIISLIKEGKISNTPFCKYINTKYHLILNYCTNILYYILMKARRTAVQSHPVIQRLFQYRQMLKQLESVDIQTLSQVDGILEKIKRGEDVEWANTRKIKQSRHGKTIRKKGKEENHMNKKYNTMTNEIEVMDTTMAEGENDSEEGNEGTENTRRAITYQIAKNKGLTPYRKKELRNPRVKHRMKYRKAKIRRKGQVREPRTELQKYGGEISGIKIGISKSIKL